MSYYKNSYRGRNYGKSRKQNLDQIVGKAIMENTADTNMQLDSLRRDIGVLQHDVDVLYGADPVELQTPERRAWKTEVTNRVSAIRKNHPDPAVRNNYKRMFGILYKDMERNYGIILNDFVAQYAEVNDIPIEGKSHIRALNVVYFYSELQEYFLKTVEKYEEWYKTGRYAVKEA